MADRSTLSGIAGALAPLLYAATAGCGAHHGDLTVGKDPSQDAAAPTAGQAGQDSAGRAGATAVPAGGTRALDADIQNREGVALDLVTVACAGDCFEVVAVARGGYPPYTYRWEDGSSNAVRKLCPDASQAFEVMATDRGYQSEEFKRDAETVAASVTAEVLACPDAGVPDAGRPPPVDAGAPDAGSKPKFKWEPMCIPHGSFEDGTVEPWRACPPSDPSRGLNIQSGDGVGQPEAVDGMWYLRLDPEPGQPVTVSVRLCEPVVTGTGYYWTHSWMLGFGSGPVALEFYFASTECGLDGKLSDSFPSGCWARVCSNWPALWDAEYLTIRAVATGNRGGTVFIDELLDISASCPPPYLPP